METKGYRRPAFDLRWKMFKAWLNEHHPEWLVMMPSTQKEVDECINLINDAATRNRDVLQLSASIELNPERNSSAAVVKTKKRKSKTRGG